MSGQERLGRLVYEAWAESKMAHEQLKAGPPVSGGPVDVLQAIGDVAVQVSTAHALWDVAVQLGEATGDWERALELLCVAACDVMADRRSTGLIGTAVLQVRSIACQAVLTRVDEIRARSAT